MAQQSHGDELETLEEFCFVRRPSEAAEATAELPRSARQPRLSRFLRLGRRPAAPAPPQEAPPPPPAAPLLAEIPVLEMPPAHAAAPMLITPLSAQPLGGPGGAWGGFGGATVSGDGPHGQGIWLQQQLELTGGAASMRSSISGISLCSDCSVEECGAAGGGSGGDALNAGSRSSSYCLLPRPTSMNVLLAGSSGSGSGSSTATRSSGSDLLHQLMLQAEPGAAASTPPAPVAGDVHLPYPTLPSAEAVVLSMEPRVAPPSQQQQQQQQVYAAVMPRVPQQSAAGGEYTPNPLLQKEQAALLSWRRNAWQHSERQEPELLHHLLSSSGEDAEGLGAVSPLAGTTAGTTSRGRATAKHLLALTAILALAVVLLHLLHSHALAMQLAGEQEEQLLQNKAQAQVTSHGAFLGDQAGYNGYPVSSSAKVLLRGRRGAGGGWGAGRPLGELPRMRLRRLTVLVWMQRPTGRSAQLQARRDGEELVVEEEWELST